MKKKITFDKSDVEAGAYYAAAEVLLVGLKHIKEHDFSYPADLTAKRWRVIVDEIIWLLELLTSDEDWVTSPEERKRYDRAKRYLGKYFDSIWC